MAARARNTRLVYNSAEGWVWAVQGFGLCESSRDRLRCRWSIPVRSEPSVDSVARTAPSWACRSSVPASGFHALSTFPLEVSIAKQAGDPEDAKIFYSTTPGVWSVYSEPFSADPGTNVQAFTTSVDPTWSDSETAFGCLPERSDSAGDRGLHAEEPGHLRGRWWPRSSQATTRPTRRSVRSRSPCRAAGRSRTSTRTATSSSSTGRWTAAIRTLRRPASRGSNSSAATRTTTAMATTPAVSISPTRAGRKRQGSRDGPRRR